MTTHLTVTSLSWSIPLRGCRHSIDTRALVARLHLALSSRHRCDAVLLCIVSISLYTLFRALLSIITICTHSNSHAWRSDATRRGPSKTRARRRMDFDRPSGGTKTNQPVAVGVLNDTAARALYIFRRVARQFVGPFVCAPRRESVSVLSSVFVRSFVRPLPSAASVRACVFVLQT